MSTLQAGFRFSRFNLEDYTVCPSQFRLRHLDQVIWPALRTARTAEYDERMARGRFFHTLIQQHTLGLDVTELVGGADEQIQGWWQAFISQGPAIPAGRVFTEIELTAPLLRWSIVARFDRVIAQPDGRILIIDWKAEDRLPKRAWVEHNFQTRVYLYVMAEAGHQLAGRPITPDSIEMLYWWANYPQQSIHLPYNQAWHSANRSNLEASVAQIAAEPEDGFPLTDDLRVCALCEYRSLHGRDISAADPAQISAESNLSMETLELDMEGMLGNLPDLEL
ncbi:MAG: PD-(D/E)XK nuclease family protein [Chloroflexi bacterium]|nr:PD-(D/E)XK nuclease family protein [Chloroflexota bacterium]